MSAADAVPEPGQVRSVQVLAGPGIVARYGDVLVWLEEGQRRDPTIVADLLALARGLAGEGDVRHAGARVAEVLRRDATAVPAMVLVAPTGGGIQAIVHGWGRVLGDGIDINGGWVDRQIGWTPVLGAGRGGDLLRLPVAGSVLDLRRGTTPGGGVAVTLADRQKPTEPVVPIGAEGQGPATSSSDVPEVRTGRAPLPVGAAARTTGTTVKGVVCSRGHFNNPIAVACATCGVSMGDVSRILQDGIRPSLGALVLDDGTTYGLDADHLVGSAPGSSAGGGGTRPVTLVDVHGQVAPVHVEVRLVGWDVELEARAPAFVLPHGTQQWVPLPPGQPTPVPTGARVAVGQRTFVIEPAGRGGV